VESGEWILSSNRVLLSTFYSLTYLQISLIKLYILREY
jgi:hypothetical protein